MRNRYDNLFKELDDYRKKNSELSKELRKIKEDFTSMNNENVNYEYISGNEITEKLNKLKKENDYLKGVLNRHNIKVK